MKTILTVLRANAVLVALGLALLVTGPVAFVMSGRMQPGPQDYTSAGTLVEARDISRAMPDHGAAGRFFAWDFALIVAYSALSVLLACRLRTAMKSMAASFGWRWLPAIAGGAGLLAGVSDAMENRACLRLLHGELSLHSLAAAHAACLWKWLLGAAAVVLFLTGAVHQWRRKPPCMTAAPQGATRPELPPEGLPRAETPSGREAQMMAALAPAEPALSVATADGPLTGLPLVWALVVRATRFAMRARFPILGSVLLLVVLVATDPGRDLVRAVCYGCADGLSPQRQGEHVEWLRLGYFLFGVVVLTAQCMGWARVLLAPRLQSRLEQEATFDQRVWHSEQRIRRDLPALCGAGVLLAVAAAFFLAFYKARTPAAQQWEELPWLLVAAPPVLVLLAPLTAILFRSGKPPRRRMRVAARWWSAVALLLIAVSMWTPSEDPKLMASDTAGLLSLACVAAAIGVWHVSNSWPCVIPLSVYLIRSMRDGSAVTQSWITAMLIVGFLALGNHVRGSVPWAGRGPRRLKLEEIDDLPPPRELVRIALADSQPEFKTLRLHLRWAAMSCFFQLGLWVTITVFGQDVCRHLGGAAVFCVGLAAWVLVGAVLVFLTMSRRLPVMTLALTWAVVCGLLTNNHFVRVSVPDPAAGEGAQAGKHDFSAAFDAWLQRQPPSSGGPVPCVIVATEGGGIRAAYWTGIVLGALQDLSGGRFAERAFAICGVSGGSVGAAFFSAACAGGSKNVREKMGRMLSQDHLAPAVGALMYSDLVQRFLPVPVFQDRAAALEDAWQWAAGQNGGTNRMAQPFLSLWAGEHKVPSLLFNGTEVESGSRIIVSNLKITSGAFAHATDAHDLLTERSGDRAWMWDVPLATAAHMSARFPYISPPGTFPAPEGHRVVDGGYFENSGASTAVELTNAILRLVHHRRAQAGTSASPPEAPAAHPPAVPAVHPVIVFIRYQDEPPPASARPQARTGGYFFNELFSPLLTLVRTRAARGHWHEDFIRGQLAFHGEEVTTILFASKSDDGDVPLSWTLSAGAARDLENDMPASLTAGTGQHQTDEGDANEKALRELFARLKVFP